MRSVWREIAIGVAVWVLGTAAVSFFGSISGRWPTIWAGVKSPASLPVAVLVFLTISTVYAWGRIVVDARVRLVGSALGVRTPLSRSEQSVLEVFAAVDGRPLLVDHLVRHTGGVKLKAENAVDELIGRGFLEGAPTPDGAPEGFWYGLTAAGRKYVVDNEYVGRLGGA